MELPKRITLARESAGLDVAHASKLLSISELDLVAWESGQAEPSIQQISNMCTQFGVSPDFLLLGNDPDGKFTPRCCQFCGNEIPLNAVFCPNCGNKTDSVTLTDAERTYTIVLSTDYDHLNWASTGIRCFFQNSDYYSGCTLENDIKCNTLSEHELQSLIDSDIEKITKSSFILCKNLPYETVINTVDLFHDRANIFVFYDEAGETLEELRRAAPVIQHMIGEPPFECDTFKKASGTFKVKSMQQRAFLENTQGDYPQLVCPKCGSTECTPIVETSTSGKDFSAGKGCCGFVLLGPLGILCGACGEGKQTASTTYWMCSSCGTKFQK